MRYDVTYQVGGDERTERVDAPDAASAAGMIQSAHGRDEGQFELISVSFVDDVEAAEAAQAASHEAAMERGAEQRPE